MDLVALIRGGSSLEEIKSYLDDETRRSRLEGSPEVDGIYREVRRLQRVSQSQGSRSSQMDIRRLTDVPLFDLPAKPWTTITSDDQFVSHLVSLWFTWSTQFFNWVDWDDFISGMKSGNLSSEFCSPFLVNAMLAEACVSIPLPVLYTTSSDDGESVLFRLP